MCGVFFCGVYLFHGVYCGTVSETEDDSSYVPFVTNITCGIKIMKHNTITRFDLQNNTKNVVLCFFGPLWILTWDNSRDLIAERKNLENSFHLNFHYDIRDRIPRSQRIGLPETRENMAGDCLGYHWIPDSSIILPFVKRHCCELKMDTDLSDENDMKCCGFYDISDRRTRISEWRCDLNKSPYYEMLNPHWLFCPDMWEIKSRQRVVNNILRQFLLDSWV